MPLVLFDRRGNSNVFLAIIRLEFSSRADLKLVGEVLRFENVNVKEAIYQKMIDLGDLIVIFEP